MYSQVFSCSQFRATLVSLQRLKLNLSSVQYALGSTLLRIPVYRVTHGADTTPHSTSQGGKLSVLQVHYKLTNHSPIPCWSLWLFQVVVNGFYRHFCIHLPVGRCFYFSWCELYCSIVIWGLQIYVYNKLLNHFSKQLCCF